MERISIFNYEIFYLDYLEGNLTEEETRMLMTFLEKHPECKLENEELPSLAAEEPEEAFVFSNKASLKQVDDNEAITLGNVEHFMISETEDLLSTAKQEELNAFTKNNAPLTAERKRYAAVHVEPDMSMTYADKASLKKTKTIVLWPYMSGAVAAAVIAIVFILGGNRPSGNMGEFGNHYTVPEFALTGNPIQDGTQETIIPGTEPIDIELVAEEQLPSQPKKAIRLQNDDSHNNLEKRPLKELKLNKGLHEISPRDIKPIHIPDVAINTSENNTAAPALAQAPEALTIEHPIAPITSFISEKTNTEIAFGQKKSETKEKSGFLIKIGNFELERSKH